MLESNVIHIISRAKRSAIAGMIVLFCFMNGAAARAADNPKVLVLHSYHSGFQWTDDQNSAIINSLRSAYPAGDVFVEYMNTKRVALDVMSPMLRQNYATLFRKARPDVIIATDNNALDFLLKYGDELFPGVPVVFCGINNFDDYNLDNRRNYTGVREDFDTGATLDIMLRFHPDTRTVAMIADVTESSQITLAIARKVARAKKYGNIRFVELSGLSETDLAERLDKLEKGTIILLLSYYRSPEGRVFSVKDGTQLIQKHTQLPVYALWDFYMLPPVIGGKIVTGTLQGKAAGEIAIRILKGEKPDAIAPYSCPTSYYFNYDALQKYNIPDSLIPADSIVAGKPDTFYAKYKTYIWFGAAFTLSLIITILILLRSIVIQRRNESALRTSEEKFRVLFENAIEGIFQTSHDGRLLNANPAMAHILGFASPDDLKTRLTNAWELYLHPGERDLFLSSILQHETVRGMELQFRCKDKQAIWVAINARLVRDEAGTPLFVEGFLSDITERKRAEEEVHVQAVALEQEVAERQMAQESLQEQATLLEEEVEQRQKAQKELEKLNENLEQRVQERTAELREKNAEVQQAYDDLKRVQAQLLQQDKMASVGQLAAGVAHEINNPMGFIISNLSSLGTYVEKITAYLDSDEKILAGSDPVIHQMVVKERQKYKIDRICRDMPELINESADGAQRVRQIVQDLKSFSRRDSTEFANADINEGLESTLSIAWNELKYKATVIREFGQLPLVWCNLGQLNQVFLNILVNAAHAIKEQGEIRIETRAEEGAVKIAISDNGSGIAPEHIKQIFDPFFTTKDVGKGTGLGLAIAYDIITNKHGGRIDVQSEVGKGSTFVITLPITDATDKAGDGRSK